MLVSNVTNIIEDIEQNRLGDLDDFLGSCIMTRISRNKDDDYLNRDDGFFDIDNPKNIDKIFLDGATDTFENFSYWWESHKSVNYWIGVTGSWRTINQKVVDDITNIVRYITSHGMGILTGGALGVDYITTEIVLKEGDPNTQLRITVPINKYDYVQHFMNSASSSVINSSQRNAIAKQMIYVIDKYPEIIFDKTSFNQKEFLDTENDEYRKDCYSFRNNLIAYACDGLVPFWVNQSKGVKDTIKSVTFMQKPILELKELIYSIDQNSDEVIRDYSKLIIPNLKEDYPLKDNSIQNK